MWQILKSLRLALTGKVYPPFMPRRIGKWSRKTRTSRLFLELLEDRTLLSVVTWTNPSGGDWDTAANWYDLSTGTSHVPGPGDDANLGAPYSEPGVNYANITITHSSSAQDTVASLESKSKIDVANGFLFVTSGYATIPTLTVEGGAQVQFGALPNGGAPSGTPPQAVIGTLTVDNRNLTSGTFSDISAVSFDDTQAFLGSVNLYGGSITAGGAPSYSTMSIGALTWVDGALADFYAPITVASGFSIGANDNAAHYETLTGTLNIDGSGNLQGGGEIFGVAGESSVLNLESAGSLTVLPGTAYTINSVVNNSSIYGVNLESGSPNNTYLKLAGGGTHSCGLH
jgi:hypothetical protein